MTICKKDWSIRKLVKLLGTCMAWVGFVGMLLSFGLSNHEVSTFPRTADPSIGRVCPRGIHGIVIYETLSEKVFYGRLEYGSFGIFGMSAMLALFYKWKWGPEPGIRPLKIGTDWRPK